MDDKMHLVDYSHCAPFRYGVDAPRLVEELEFEDEFIDDCTVNEASQRKVQQ